MKLKKVMKKETTLQVRMNKTTQTTTKTILMINMIRYYKHWKTTTDDPKIIKYCDRMIEHFSNEDRPDLRYKRL